eukprot:6189192-Pleurochrysis_carterae.AAC.2
MGHAMTKHTTAGTEEPKDAILKPVVSVSLHRIPHRARLCDGCAARRHGGSSAPPLAAAIRAAHDNYGFRLARNSRSNDDSSIVSCANSYDE